MWMGFGPARRADSPSLHRCPAGTESGDDISLNGAPVMSDKLLVSADSHVIEDPQLWKKRLPRSFQDKAPVFPELKVGGAFQARPGGHDPKARLSEMAE